MGKKYKKSDWQKVKERFRMPFSIGELCAFWKQLEHIPGNCKICRANREKGFR